MEYFIPKIMENNEKIIAVLNNLLEINNDRISGYELATKKAEDSDLKSLFSDMTATGFKLCHDLRNEVEKLKGEAQDSLSTSGNNFDAWTEVRSAILTKDRNAILNSCEVGEKEALNSYEDALNQEELKNNPVVTRVQQQRLEILLAHKKIKNIRENEE